jgi:NADH-quinone oxidoreductase subunit J
MILFVIFAITSIAAAVGVVASRKPVYSALFLLVNFASLACLYIMLQAQFLAAVQVIVYAGAIVVLFLFVVMLLGDVQLSDMGRPGTRRPSWPRLTGMVLAVLLAAGLVTGIVRALFAPAASATPAFGQGSIEALGQALYTTYLVPFELTSVLLLVGMIGALVLAGKPKKDDRE